MTQNSYREQQALIVIKKATFTTELSKYVLPNKPWKTYLFAKRKV